MEPLARKWKVFVALAVSVTVVVVGVTMHVTDKHNFMYEYIKFPFMAKPTQNYDANGTTTLKNLNSSMNSAGEDKSDKKSLKEDRQEIFEKNIRKFNESIQSIQDKHLNKTLATTKSSLNNVVTMPGLVSMDRDLRLPPEVPLRPDSKEIILNYSQRRDYSPIISHDDKCSTGSTTFTDLSLKRFNYETDTFLLMVIKSSCKHRDRRDAIRSTWGGEKWVIENTGVIVKKVFLLGDCTSLNDRNELVEEDKLYGDILQWDFFDSFRNLTLKECLFLQWFSRHCQNVPYIFKGDDDVFVNIKNIIIYLKDLPRDKRDNLFRGSVIRKSPRIVNPSLKYYVSYNLYPKKFYPPYASGGGFIMSSNLAIRLFLTTLQTRIFPIDDAFLGTLLQSLSVKPQKDKTFKSWGLKSTVNACRLAKIKTYHKVDPKMLISMWETYIQTDIDKCPEDTNDVFLQWQKRK